MRGVNPLIIRELKVEDINSYKEIMLELLIEVYKISFNLPIDDCTLICKEKIQLLNNYIAEGSAIVIGAIIDEKLAGFLWIYKHQYFGEQRMHINQIGVCKPYRGIGIGKSLIEEMENLAKVNGVNTVDLFVSESNVNALNMYKNLGFRTEKRYMKKKL